MQELQQSRDAQDRELGRLRNEAMALVASTTSLEQQSQESVARLAHRADEAEMRAQGLVGEGEGTHCRVCKGPPCLSSQPLMPLMHNPTNRISHYDDVPSGSSSILNM